MKFWKKLVLFVITVVSIILAFSRYYIVKNNFLHSIETTSKQYENQYELERYMLENEFVNIIQEGEEITDEKIIEYIKKLYSIENQSELFALYNEKYEKIYSNKTMDELKVNSIFNEKTEGYCFRKVGDKHYMLFSTNWLINDKKIYILNAYDVSEIYKEKDRQLKEILITDIIILIISITVIFIFSIFLTKPIDSLNKIAKKIAYGKFNERVNIKSKDEIGELASSFNIMAEQVENKINELNLQVKKKNDFMNRIYS